MKRNVFRVMGLSAVIAAAMAFTSFAATNITNVVFTCGAPEDDTITSGITDPEFLAEDAIGYELIDCSAVSETTNYKNARTYELNFMAQSGYTFPNADSISVSGTGITQIIRKKVQDDGDTLLVRIKAYPYFQLDAPIITTEDYSSPSTTKIVWEKNGGNNFEYLLVWEDVNGDEHYKQGKTTSTSISVSSYNKEVTEKQKENGKQDAHVTGFAIRAIGSASGNTRIAPSPWAKLGSDVVGDFDVVEYESWSDLGMGKAVGNVKTSSSTSATTTNNYNTNNAGPGYTQTQAAGWVGSGSQWYYRNANGTNQTGWIYDGSNWYFCDSTGLMQAGWKQDGGYWYYLNENHDGTYGRMLTSWQTINGKTYYFRPNAGGPQGSMVTGTVNIGGTTYTFDNLGALQR